MLHRSTLLTFAQAEIQRLEEQEKKKGTWNLSKLTSVSLTDNLDNSGLCVRGFHLS